jgi:uncharacterized protein
MQISTGAGPAQAAIDRPKTATFLILMTHGAGGGVDTKDLLAVRDAALGLGGVVARVLQPYRVRGARAPGAPGPQDAAWLDIVAALRTEFPGLPLVQGGRSNGARVACRTAGAASLRWRSRCIRLAVRSRAGSQSCARRASTYLSLTGSVTHSEYRRQRMLPE